MVFTEYFQFYLMSLHVLGQRVNFFFRVIQYILMRQVSISDNISVYSQSPIRVQQLGRRRNAFRSKVDV